MRQKPTRCLFSLYLTVCGLIASCSENAHAADAPDYEVESTESQQLGDAEDIRLWLLNTWSAAPLGIMIGTQDGETIPGSNANGIHAADFGVGSGTNFAVTPQVTLRWSIFAGYSDLRANTGSNAQQGVSTHMSAYFLDNRLGLVAHESWYDADNFWTRLAFGFGVGSRGILVKEAKSWSGPSLPNSITYPYLSAAIRF